MNQKDESKFEFQISSLTFIMSQLFWTLFMSIGDKLRDLGIEGLKDNINILKEIGFLQFLNPSIPKLDPCPIIMQFLDKQRLTAIFSN